MTKRGRGPVRVILDLLGRAQRGIAPMVPPGATGDGDNNVANSASAKKRIRQNEKRRTQNRARKAMVKTETGKLLDALHDGELQKAQQLFSRVTKKLDQTAAKGTLHRNTVARRKSRLAKRLNAAQAAKAG